MSFAVPIDYETKLDHVSEKKIKRFKSPFLENVFSESR